MILAILLTLAALVSEPSPSLFEKMDDQSKKATGIAKLSIDEQKALEAWLVAAKSPPAIENEISQVTDEIRFTMKNGEVYEATSRYKKMAKSVKIGDKVLIAQSRKPIWYKMQQQSGLTIGVKKICPTTSQNQ